MAIVWKKTTASGRAFRSKTPSSSSSSRRSSSSSSSKSDAEKRREINEAMRSTSTAKNYTVRDAKTGEVIKKVGSGGNKQQTVTRVGIAIGKDEKTGGNVVENLSGMSQRDLAVLSDRTSRFGRQTYNKATGEFTSERPQTIVIGIAKDERTGGNVVENVGAGFSQQQKQQVSDLTDTYGRLSASKTGSGYNFSVTEQERSTPKSSSPSTYQRLSGAPIINQGFFQAQEDKRLENAPYKRFETRIDRNIAYGDDDNLDFQSTRTDMGGVDMNKLGFKPSIQSAVYEGASAPLKRDLISLGVGEAKAQELAESAQNRFGLPAFSSSGVVARAGTARRLIKELLDEGYIQRDQRKDLQRYFENTLTSSPTSYDIANYERDLRIASGTADKWIDPIFSYVNVGYGATNEAMAGVQALTRPAELAQGFYVLGTNKQARQEAVMTISKNFQENPEKAVGMGLTNVGFLEGLNIFRKSPRTVKPSRALLKEVFDEQSMSSKINYAQEVEVFQQGFFRNKKIDTVQVMGEGTINWKSSTGDVLPYGIFEQRGSIRSTKNDFVFNFKETGAVSQIDDLSIFRSGLELANKEFVIEGVSKSGLTSSLIKKVDNVDDVNKMIGTETSLTNSILEIRKPKEVNLEGLQIKSLTDFEVIRSFETESVAKTFSHKKVNVKIDPYNKEIVDPQGLLSSFQKSADKPPLVITKIKSNNLKKTPLIYVDLTDFQSITSTPSKIKPFSQTSIKTVVDSPSKIKPFPQTSIKTVVDTPQSSVSTSVVDDASSLLLQKPTLSKTDSFANTFTASTGSKVKTLFPDSISRIRAGFPLGVASLAPKMSSSMSIGLNTFQDSPVDNLLKNSVTNISKVNMDVTPDVSTTSILSTTQGASTDLINDVLTKQKVIPKEQIRRTGGSGFLIPPPPPTKLPEFDRKKPMFSGLGGYTAVVGKRGNVNYRSYQGRTRAEVVEKARADVDNTLGASFKVYKDGKNLKPSTVKKIKKSLGTNYRRGKKDKTRFVEKTKYRLDSKNEINALLNARTMKGTKDIGKLINKGYSLRNIRTVLGGRK